VSGSGWGSAGSSSAAAAAGLQQPGRIPIKAGIELEDLGADAWYVVVHGKPVTRYEDRGDAEACARNW
jgi:hypothetical protein